MSPLALTDYLVQCDVCECNNATIGSRSSNFQFFESDVHIPLDAPYHIRIRVLNEM